MKKFLILAVLLSITVSIIPACSATEKANNDSAAAASSTGKGGHSLTADGNNQTNANKPSVTSAIKQIDIFSSFKPNDDYKTIVRPSILKDGWQPARSEAGEQNCQSGVKMCEEYPELEAGPAARMGNIIFRWKKVDKILLIHTVDDPPVYSEHEFEKSAKQSSKLEVIGKYELSEIGLSGNYTLELKNNQTAMLKILEEDGTSIGTGSWSWDSAKELLTVTISVKYEAAGSEVTGKKPEASEILFQFTRAGKNLKIANQTLAPDVSYAGKLFKKL